MKLFKRHYKTVIVVNLCEERLLYNFRDIESTIAGTSEFVSNLPIVTELLNDLNYTPEKIPTECIVTTSDSPIEEKTLHLCTHQLTSNIFELVGIFHDDNGTVIIVLDMEY